LILGWTLNHAIQPYVDVYVSQATFVEVQRSFPYLVTKEYASGGGDVGILNKYVLRIDTYTLMDARSRKSNGISLMIKCLSKSQILV